ncbi:MAG: nucleotide pyrophosphohydrolase [Anaerolineaceae bacterium]|nr:nucleotide pyrophosphohydrolase [Anaerolineaceae bacterium]
MELRELTQAMHQFVQAKGWYDPDSIHPQTARNIAISLALESAEVLEHFQWSEQSRDFDQLPGELADVALYLLQLSSILNIDLEKAILEKLKTNYGRSWDQERK